MLVPVIESLQLSHVWGTAQDQVSVIKRMLQQLVPGVRVFLDVDDLQDIGDLEGYINRSQCVLLFFSRAYFNSRNCRREIESAVNNNKPLVVVHEEDESHGGLPLDALRREFRGQEWSVTGIEALLFDRTNIILWQRVKAFQILSMRMIGEALVSACPRYAHEQSGDGEKLFIPGGIHLLRFELRPSVFIYFSRRFNPGVEDMVEELDSHMHPENTLARAAARARATASAIADTASAIADAPDTIRDAATAVARRISISSQESFGSLANLNASEGFGGLLSLNASNTGSISWAVSDRRTIGAGTQTTFSWRRPPAAGGLPSLESFRAISRHHNGVPLASRMLLYLNESTFAPPAGDRLAAELRCARKNHVPIVMLHENDPEKGGCPFSHFFSVTPQDLIDDGLYSDLAIGFQRKPFRVVSLALACKALGARAVQTSCFSCNPFAAPYVTAEVEQPLKTAAPVAERAHHAAALSAVAEDQPVHPSLTPLEKEAEPKDEVDVGDVNTLESGGDDEVAYVVPDAALAAVVFGGAMAGAEMTEV